VARREGGPAVVRRLPVGLSSEADSLAIMLLTAASLAPLLLACCRFW
jgi:hypothetical protein